MTGQFNRRTFLKGMGGVAGAVLLGGCNPSPPRPPAPGGRPTLRIEEWTSLGFPSPYTATAGPGYWRASLMYDTLTWADSTGTQMPWLASSFRVSPDGLVYSVDLRNNLTWKDGVPLTARDVVFTHGYYSARIFTPLLVGVPPKDIQVVATGDRTVEFRLPRPDATFLQQVLGTMPITPEHMWSKVADPMSFADKDLLIGTGAYTLTSRDDAQGTEEYVANDGYFLGTPWVQRIQMLPADNPMGALEAGELDAASSDAEGVTDEVLAPFRDNPEFGMVSQEAAYGFPLFFNLSRGGALADLRFRRACAHALDRRAMVDRLLTGNGQVGSAGWLPSSHPMSDPGVREYPFNKAEAERLLDEAGYRRGPGGGRMNPNGSPLRFVLHIPEAVPIALAEFIAKPRTRSDDHRRCRRVTRTSGGQHSALHEAGAPRPQGGGRRSKGAPPASP